MDNSPESILKQIFDSFDHAWQSGENPDVSRYVEQNSDADSDELVEELIKIDLKNRQQRQLEDDPSIYSQLGDKAVSFAADYRSKLQSIADDPDRRAEQTVSDDTPPSQIGPYKILEKIGEGGMGTVWLAEQQQPVRRRVAIKLIKAALASKQVIARFEAERQALAMMDHPNIAKVLEGGTTETGNPYFVMELVEGVPINEYCDRHKLNPNQRLKIFVSVCQAVQHAHQKGIIHRDLKPSNVLVQIHDGKPNAKVIDFGLAKALQHQTRLTDKTLYTEFGQVLGTLQYMSPEQAMMDVMNIDTRSDIYSLGVMLYELLAGSTPIDKDTLNQNALLEVLEVIREKDPPLPSQRLSSLGDKNQSVGELRQIQPIKLQRILRGELDWVVMKALDKDRTRRYETADAFAADIQRYLTGDPVVARPPSATYRIGKFVRKNRGLVATLATLLLVLILGISGTTFGLIKANQKTSDAIRQKKIANEKTKEAIASQVKEKVARANAENARLLIARDSAAAKFQLANARWDANRVGEARDLLDRIPIEYRNFEWYYCKRRFLGSDLTCYHTHPVSCVDFSPNGRLLAAACWDNTVKLWESQTGQELISCEEHSDVVSCVAFSPNGTEVASGSWDKTIKLWNTNSGKPETTFMGHLDRITSIAFDQNGTRLASTSRDNTVKVWDVDTGELILNIDGHSDHVLRVAFSPEGKRLVTAGRDAAIYIWNTETGKIIRTINGHSKSVSGVCFDPEGLRIASCSADSTIRIWETDTGKNLTTINAHDSLINDIAFSPSGNQIASASNDHSARIWDLDGNLIHTLAGHSSSVKAVAFSPDGSRLASCSWDCSAKIWDAATGQPDLTLTGHDNRISSLAAAGNSKIVTGSFDGTIKVWETSSLQLVKTLHDAHAQLSCIAVSPDGELMASGSWDNTIKIWDPKTGKTLRKLTGHSNRIYSLAFSPDNTRLVSGSWDRSLKIWDPRTGKELNSLKGHSRPVVCVTFSPNGKLIATGSWDMSIGIWEASSGKRVNTFNGHSKVIHSIAFSPDGTSLASGGADRSIIVWDIESGTKLSRRKGCDAALTSVVFSHDGERIASTSQDGTIQLWDIENETELQTIFAHSKDAQSAIFLCDNKLVSVGGDKKIKLWHAPQLSETQKLCRMKDLIRCVAFSPNGSQVAFAIEGKMFYVLDIDSRRIEKTFAGHTQFINHIAFSSDGKRIFSKSLSKESPEKLVWDVATAKLIPNAAWLNVTAKTKSPDGRYMVCKQGHDVILVDLEFKNLPEERMYRKFKARYKHWWHHQQAIEAKNAKDWYAAMFHFAWLIHGTPESSSFYDGLQQSYARLTEQFGTRTIVVPKVVRDALNIPVDINDRGRTQLNC